MAFGKVVQVFSLEVNGAVKQSHCGGVVNIDGLLAKHTLASYLALVSFQCVTKYGRPDTSLNVNNGNVLLRQDIFTPRNIFSHRYNMQSVVLK